MSRPNSSWAKSGDELIRSWHVARIAAMKRAFIGLLPFDLSEMYSALGPSNVNRIRRNKARKVVIFTHDPARLIAGDLIGEGVLHLVSDDAEHHDHDVAFDCSLAISRRACLVDNSNLVRPMGQTNGWKNNQTYGFVRYGG